MMRPLHAALNIASDGMTPLVFEKWIVLSRNNNKVDSFKIIILAKRMVKAICHFNLTDRTLIHSYFKTLLKFLSA